MVQTETEKRAVPWRLLFILGLILTLSLVEWGLFELLRLPYRPPHDMGTFLGTEKYAVRGFMVIAGISGGALIAYLLATSALSIREYLGITSLVALIAALGAAVVRYPSWPVTPWELLWQ